MQPISSIEEYVNCLYTIVSTSLTHNHPQPQRPVRNLKIYGDENAIPTVAGQKTLHSRNKSSPALSTLAKAGGLKATARRTAFGDVSNTVNGARPKDDTALDPKRPRETLEKSLPLNAESRSSTIFLKPAQRPTKPSSLKHILDGVTSSSVAPTREPFAEAQQPQQPNERPPAARKLSKRAPTVYHDAAPIQVKEPEPKVQKSTSSIAPLPPAHRELPAKSHSNQVTGFSLDDLIPQSRLTSNQDSQHQSTSIDTNLTSSASTVEESAALRSDGIYIDGNGEVQVYQLLDEPDAVDERVVSSRAEPPRPLEQPPHASVDFYDYHSVAQGQSEFLKFDAVPTSEYPEYWEDDDDENYEEEAYVTARSFKLRGDNTTNGATTILFPKVTQRSKKEIAAATALIKASKTPDEIDDEAWDTTMVAEYGDEIFQYMRDLEVNYHIPNPRLMH